MILSFQVDTYDPITLSRGKFNKKITDTNENKSKKIYYETNKTCEVVTINEKIDKTLYNEKK